MRLVLDTNIVISALLWHGAPRRLLQLAHSSAVQLYTSLPLLFELDEVLRRDKFRVRLQEAQVTADDLVLGFAALATVVEPPAITPVVLSDPDDDNVLACALAAYADVVVSGDRKAVGLPTSSPASDGCIFRNPDFASRRSDRKAVGLPTSIRLAEAPFLIAAQFDPACSNRSYNFLNRGNAQTELAPQWSFHTCSHPSPVSYTSNKPRRVWNAFCVIIRPKTPSPLSPSSYQHHMPDSTCAAISAGAAS